MIQQLDFFKAPAPMNEQASFIGENNTPILFPPSPEPTGTEAAERKAARLREIKDREIKDREKDREIKNWEAAKTLERILNGNGPRRWEVTVP